MFRNPYVFPCRETVAETAKGLVAGFRGNDGKADGHFRRADEAQHAAVQRGTNARSGARQKG